jgi:osomolarity two-component system response regulator SSK1
VIAPTAINTMNLSSPRPRPRKLFPKTLSNSTNSSRSTFPAGVLDGAVPPINVLIVEDNIINLKLLEAFMKRLKVRWQTAMNGRDAVNKWRTGGFHLVLMDIQLPVMNGLEATKEIRRLERVNNIGVFGGSESVASVIDPSSSSSSNAEDGGGVKPVADTDKLSNTILFKSPVIIVALTASSLQSDRHEALAAGCNDFLTKVRSRLFLADRFCQRLTSISSSQPVNFVWLERKVREWGCMQALIDFDGWRKWKDFSQATAAAAATAGTPEGGIQQKSITNKIKRDKYKAGGGGAPTATAVAAMEGIGATDGPAAGSAKGILAGA